MSTRLPIEEDEIKGLSQIYLPRTINTKKWKSLAEKFSTVIEDQTQFHSELDRFSIEYPDFWDENC